MVYIVGTGLLAFLFAVVATAVATRCTVSEAGLKYASVWWAMLSATLGWADFFMALLISRWVVVPSVLGVGVGQWWAIRRERKLAGLPSPD